MSLLPVSISAAPRIAGRAHGGLALRRALRRAVSGVLNGALLVAALSLSLPTIAFAQHAGGDAGTAPPPPAGDGRVRVRVVNADTPTDVAGLAIALYSLGADGRPGFTDGETDASGEIVFERLSSDPGIVYLVGARYRDIPFGERVRFEAGEQEATVEIQVSVPTDRVAGVWIEELRVRIDWLGDRLLVREIVRLVNPGSRVIRLEAGTAAGASARAIVSRPLVAKAREFELGGSSFGDGLALVDGVVRYVGPLYPGNQGIEYQYSLPIEPGERRVRLPVELGQASSRVVAVAGTAGITISGPELVASSAVQSDSGKALEAWARSGLRAGESIWLEVALPQARVDPSLVSIARADVWLDLDDTRLTATADLQLEVAPGSPVAGTPERPLLSVLLPAGASLTGVAPEAESLGLIPRDHGGFDVVGPIGEGTTQLGYAYRLDAGPEGVALDLRFSRPVSTLNVLVADTGLALDSGRLHRLRPFRSGTRNYLHREAFNVLPDEAVDLRIAPLRARGLPSEASLALAFAAIASSVVFLIAPLLRRARGLPPHDAGVAERERLHAEREATYVAIADLDHDFETGKLERADYESQRAQLRGRAIDLLRAEREGEDATAAGDVGALDAPAHGSAVEAPPAEAPDTASAAPIRARFCPSCGVATTPEWRFCAGCGAALPALDSGPRTGRREPGA